MLPKFLPFSRDSQSRCQNADTRSAGRLAAAAVGLCAGLLLSAAAASASAWITFDFNLNAESHQEPRRVNLRSVSCPDSSLCVAVGSAGTYAVSMNPSAGASSWAIYNRPPDNQLDGDLRSVDCPTAGLCVAVEYDGIVQYTTNPGGGAAAWHAIEIPAEHLRGISCPKVSLCIAVGELGEIARTANPRGGSGAWTVEQLAGRDRLHAVACTAAAPLCVGVGESPIFTSTSPLSEVREWHSVGEPPGAVALTSVECPSAEVCLAGDVGSVLVTTDPTGPAAGWRREPLATNFQALGLSCINDTACVAATDNGEVFSSTNPTAPEPTWSPAEFPGESPIGLQGASCPSTSLCVAAGRSAQMAYSTDPFAPTSPTPRSTVRASPPRTILFGRQRRRLRLKPGKSTIGIHFLFTANGAVTGFRCKLDRRPYRHCRSPQQYALRLGRHVFKVEAFGPGGIDTTPASIGVRVLRPRR